MLELYKTICGDAIISKSCNNERENKRIVSLLEEVEKENCVSCESSIGDVRELRYFNNNLKQ